MRSPQLDEIVKIALEPLLRKELADLGIHNPNEAQMEAMKKVLTAVAEETDEVRFQ